MYVSGLQYRGCFTRDELLAARRLADLTAAEAATGSNLNIIFVTSLTTWYYYWATGSGYTANDTTVLTTGDGGDTRWIGFAGTYLYESEAITPAPTTEEIQDIVGAMLGGTQTRITVSYDDGAGALDFVVDAFPSVPTTEEIQDIMGSMATGGTQSGVTVTYTDSTGVLNFVADATSNSKAMFFFGGGS